MAYGKAFIGGFLATLIFHQGVYALFYLVGADLPAPPFNMTATAPLGIPAVISLAFWGGVWGLPIINSPAGGGGVRSLFILRRRSNFIPHHV